MLRPSAESLSEILGAGGARADLFTSSLGSIPDRHTVFRADPDDGLQLPHVVLPESFQLEDFFVNVATYHQSRSPVSAFVHVLDEECAGYFDLISETKNVKDDFASRRRFAALGTAVGETFLAALGSAEAGVVPSYAACKRSLSYVLTRARLVYPFCRADYVAKRWVKLRQLTSLSVSNEAVGATRVIHHYLFESSEGLPGAINEVLAGSARDGLDEKSIQRALVGLYPALRPHVAEFDGPFDGRMKAFSQVVEQISTRSLGSELDSMAVGFFCNQIQPGSFVHGKALAKLVEFFPSALVWYGMFCGLCKEFNASQFASGLVAKLDRDAMQAFSFETRPVCDLSMDELEVLMRLPLKAELIKPSQQRTALIALLPGVDVSSRYSAEDEPHADERDRRAAESDEISTRVTMLLEDALMLIRRGKVSARRTVESNPRRQGRSKL